MYGLTQNDVFIDKQPGDLPDVMRVKPGKFKVKNSFSSDKLHAKFALTIL